MPLVRVARTGAERLRIIAVLVVSMALVTALWGAALGQVGAMLRGEAAVAGIMGVVTPPLLLLAGLGLLYVALGELRLAPRVGAAHADAAAVTRPLAAPRYGRIAAVGAAVAASFGILCTLPTYFALLGYAVASASPVSGALALAAYAPGWRADRRRELWKSAGPEVQRVRVDAGTVAGSAGRADRDVLRGPLPRTGLGRSAEVDRDQGELAGDPRQLGNRHRLLVAVVAAAARSVVDRRHTGDLREDRRIGDGARAAEWQLSAVDLPVDTPDDPHDRGVLVDAEALARRLESEVDRQPILFGDLLQIDASRPRPRRGRARATSVACRLFGRPSDSG